MPEVELDAGGAAPPAMWQSIDQLLASERSLLRRLTPAEAVAACKAGAVLVDTRPDSQRREFGEVEGARVIDRNVLEWRLDPASPDRVPWTDYDVHVVVLCQQGYSSSLVAATLQRLGLWRATDVIGGFEAWAASGLPADCAG